MLGSLFRRRVPFMAQMETAECGSVSLAMVLAYHGHYAPLAELREACGVGRDGASALAILKVAREYGLDAEGFQEVEIEDLRQLPLPAILHWRFNHFLVLERITKRKAMLVDPGGTRRNMSLKDLGKFFTGVVLAFEPGEDFHPRAKARMSLDRYLQQAKAHLPSLMQVLVVSLLLQMVGLVMPIGQKILVDRVIVPKQEIWLWGLAAAFAVTVLTQSVLTFLRSWVVQTLQMVMNTTLVREYMDHLLHLSMGFFLQRREGDLIQRMDSNSNIQNMLADRMVLALLDVFLLVGYGGLMLLYHPRLALVVMVLGIIRVLSQVAVRRVNADLSAAELAAMGSAGDALIEAIHGLETIKAVGSESSARRRWADREVEKVNTGLRRERLSQNLGALMAVINSLGMASVFFLAGREVLDQRMTLGTFSAFLTLQALFLSPLGSLLDAYSQLQYLGGHLARLDDVMSTEVEEKGTLDPKSIRGDLSLHQVHFSFPGSDQMVVQEIDLEIHAGEKIGIVGPSGAGKSTLARLLLGMYQPTGGTIHLDGVDLRELDMAKLRNRMGVVLQDTFLFNDTVRANLSLNEPDLDLSQIREAARIACIDEFIESLPQGYDSMIGENGASLSGGQRQRLSLARAIVSRPDLLLLDEATSSLDPETEASVHRNLAELGCTRILIAHRLKTVMDADRILVLDQGRIVQSGTFESLRRQPGLFQELFTSSGGGHV